MCSTPDIVEIYAEYSEDGDCSEGVVLDLNNSDIHVYGIDVNGETEELSGWEIETPKTLVADSSKTIGITYNDLHTFLTVECSTKLEDIEVSYDGDTEEGTVLDESNSGIRVTAYYENGKGKKVTDWKIASPVTLEADKTSTVTVTYEGVSEELEVKCSTVTLRSISAKYDGSTKKGVWLSEKNDDIHVTAKYKNGDKEEVTDWTIKKKKRLKAGQTSKVTIEYEGKTCTLEVTCTSKTAAQIRSDYIASCQSISYDSLARDPDQYEGQKVQFTGEVIQVMEEYGYVRMRIDVTYQGYGYYDDTVYVTYQYEDGQSKFLEDDIVTFYGEYAGLYSYESVLGATITIPKVEAKYVVLS